MIVGLLLIIYLTLMIGYRFYGDGHNYEYIINTDGNDILINETFRNDKENPSYYFQISIGEEKFYYQTYHDFKNKSKIIKNIYYYFSDNYKCILPIYIDNQFISDILCKNSNGYLYYYYNLKGINSSLDEFANSLSQHGYDPQKWIDSENKYENNDISLYYENIPSNHYLALTDYKGVLLFSKKSKKINKLNLFNADVYQKKFDFMYNNKYVVADYNSKYRFHEFFVIDIVTGEKSTLVSSYELSFDSYVQGIVEDKVYFFDKNSKKQYEIDMKKNAIKEIGNEKIGIKIYNSATNEWETVNAITAANSVLTFDMDNDVSTDGFTKFEKFGTEEFGYYFYYKEVDDKYLVYRSNVQNSEQLTYVFTTSNINNIIYFYDSVYFIDGGFIKRYSDTLGVRKIANYNELKFNENIYFSVYSK